MCFPAPKFNDRSSRCPKIPLEMQRVTECTAPACQAQEKAPPLLGGAVRQSTHTADTDCSVAKASGNSGSLPKQTPAGLGQLMRGHRILAGLRY
jgi:hypothetical protein